MKAGFVSIQLFDTDNLAITVHKKEKYFFGEKKLGHEKVAFLFFQLLVQLELVLSLPLLVNSRVYLCNGLSISESTSFIAVSGFSLSHSDQVSSCQKALVR